MSAALNSKNVQVVAALCAKINTASSNKVQADIKGKYQMKGEYCIEDNECGHKSTLRWHGDEQTIQFDPEATSGGSELAGYITESTLTPPTSALKLETEVDVMGMKLQVAFGGVGDDTDSKRMTSNFIGFSQELNAGNHASIKFRNLERFEAELSANLSGIDGSLLYEKGTTGNNELLTLTSNVDGLGFSVVKSLENVVTDGAVGIDKYVLRYDAGNCRGAIEFAPTANSSVANSTQKLSAKVECDAECGDKWKLSLKDSEVDICYERVFNIC